MLERMLCEGPERRMAQDAEHGRPPERADVWQAARYRSRLAALVKGAEVVEVPALMATDGLGLDRIEERG